MAKIMKKANYGMSEGMSMMKKGGMMKMGGKADTYTDYAGKTSKPDSYTQYKKGGVVKKAKSGFGMLSVKAGVDKNPNPTFADKIAGAKKKAKSGTKVGMHKMPDGKMMKNSKMKMGGAMAKQAAIAIAMKKAGKTPKKKMQYGGAAASMVPTMKKGGKAMYGKSMMSKGGKMKMGGKCKNGC